MSLTIRRIYEPAAASDGARVLIDRLWPRGVSKERARLTEWMRDAAPSTELRQWFGHDPARMEEFARRYRLELDHDAEKQQAVQKLRALAKKGPVTLLYAAKDPRVNHAIVLLAYLRGQAGSPPPGLLPSEQINNPAASSGVCWIQKEEFYGTFPACVLSLHTCTFLLPKKAYAPRGGVCTLMCNQQNIGQAGLLL